MKEHMDAELQGLPPLMQPPLYTLAYRMDDPLLPSSKSHPGYLKWLSLVPSFEPPIVYLMMETIPAQTALTGEVIGRGQPSTPQQLGTYNPMEPTFSDMLWRREARQLALGHPPPPHLPEVPGGGPPGPPRPLGWPSHRPQPPPEPLRGPPGGSGPGGPLGPMGPLSPPDPPGGPNPPLPPALPFPLQHPLGPPALTFDHKIRGSDVPRWDGAHDGYKLIQWISEC